MGLKVGLVLLTVIAVALAYVIMLASYDFFREATGVATQAIDESPNAGSYMLTRAFTASASYWILFLPALAGGLALVFILKAPER